MTNQEKGCLVFRGGQEDILAKNVSTFVSLWISDN